MMWTSKEHFHTYYVPSKSRCHGFYIFGTTEGGGGGRGPKKVRSINRVKSEGTDF